MVPLVPGATSDACRPAPFWAHGVDGQRKADLGNGTYLNPIIPGDHPDPTILKDGDDYYMTFSSFYSYPGIIIWHSTDLVNWAPIGPALTNLLAISLAVKPGARAALSFRWGLGPWAGWLYLTIFGSLVAFALYMQLLRDLGAFKSGNFAFVSPAIAVIAGALALGETITALSWAGMAVMLCAAFLSLRSKDLEESK